MKMPHIDEEKELYALPIRAPSRIFCLGGGGESIPEKIFGATQRRENFLGLVRGPGACSHGKF